ncbi:MAG: hypothetical protein B6D53_03105 [Candidatus Omnitrophica bacterium 4484_49]|nr:MAG: hypothetical protein B6D53_03105 [Candidatus Omnitrophica bacterium 4484_49]
MKMAVNYQQQIPILVKLQEIDSFLADLRNEIERKPLELGELKLRLEEKKKQLDVIQEDIKRIKINIKEKELELKSGEEEVKRLQSQLMQVKTNKEYKSLLMEIEGKKADNSLIEDNILDLMEEVDKKELELNKERDNFKHLEAEYSKEEARIKSEIAKIENQIKDKEKEREEVCSHLDTQLLSIYERLLKNRDGLAIVPVVNDACGGCHLSLRPQIINEIKRKDHLVTCERCSRILYLDE